MHGIRFFRGLRTLRRAAKPTAPSTSSELPAPTIEMLRSQLPNLPAEQREYLQEVLSTQSDEVNQQLKDLAGADSLEKFANQSGMLSETEYIAGLVAGNLESAQKLSDFDKPFWQSVKALSSTKSGEHTELFAQLFEVAKRMPNPKVRTEAIYMVGTYLYRQKTVRLDPVNEIEYLDALVAKNRPFRALNYWSSRKDRYEVKGSIYWTEMGALYLLETKLFSSAIALIQDLHATQRLSPRLISELIKAASVSGRQDILEKWFPVFLEIVKQHELQEVEQVTSLEDILERITPLDASGLLNVLEVLVKTQNWRYAATFWQDLGHANMDDVLKWMSLSKLPKKATEVSISPFIETLVSSEPQVLLNPALYYGWLLSLAQGSGSATDDIQLVLETMKEHNLSLSNRQAAKIVNLLVKKGLIDDAKYVAEWSRSATAAAILVRHFDKTNAALKHEYLSTLEIPLSPLLAAEILKGDDLYGHSLDDLALDQYCWRLIWANWARDSNMRQLFGKMVASRNYQPSLNLIESVVQAFLLEKDPVAAVAVLKFIKEQHQMDISPLLVASILDMAKKIQQGRMLVFAKPGKNDLTVKDGLPWEQVAKKLSGIYGEDLARAASSVEFRA